MYNCGQNNIMNNTVGHFRVVNNKIYEIIIICRAVGTGTTGTAMAVQVFEVRNKIDL